MGGVCAGMEDGFSTKYRLGDPLGNGAQGTVQTCICKETGRHYAVKVIDRSVRNAWVTYRREVEMCAMASKAPHVVRVIEDFCDSYQCFVVMDKFAGNVRKALRVTGKQNALGNKGLGMEAMRRLIYQTVTGLSHLHRLQIAHRDIKAQNLLTDRMDMNDPGCYFAISDFGLAKQLPTGHTLSAQVGTRKYWAPDLYYKHYSHNADVWAVGVLTWLAASAAYPFADEAQVKELDVFETDKVPDSLCPESVDFLRVCLEKDMLKRQSAAELLLHPWLRPAAANDVDEGSTRIDCQSDIEGSTVLNSTQVPAGTGFSWGGLLQRRRPISLLVPMPSGDVDLVDEGEASDDEECVDKGASMLSEEEVWEKDDGTAITRCGSSTTALGMSPVGMSPVGMSPLGVQWSAMSADPTPTALDTEDLSDRFVGPDRARSAVSDDPDDSDDDDDDLACADDPAMWHYAM